MYIGRDGLCNTMPHEAIPLMRARRRPQTFSQFRNVFLKREWWPARNASRSPERLRLGTGGLLVVGYQLLVIGCLRDVVPSTYA